MELRPYPKIAHQLDSNTPPVRGTWVATEKIHGAQLVVGCAPMRIGKRRAWLQRDESFFAWQTLRPQLEHLARIAQARHRGEVTVYGELCGGAYPHPDVPAVPGTTPVQTGVWYAPDLRYALFDVVADGWFQDYDEVAAIAASSGLDVVPLLGRGALNDLEQLPVRFSTLVPGRLGLPRIDGNLAEGLVLRHDRVERVDQRSQVKHKIAEFDENRFDEARALEPNMRLGVANLTAVARRLVNPARISSARSKVGTSPHAVEDEVLLDVIVDLCDAYPAAMAELSGAQEEQLIEEVRAAYSRA